MIIIPQKMAVSQSFNIESSESGIHSASIAKCWFDLHTWQPLYCLHFSPVVWLRVTEIYNILAEQHEILKSYSSDCNPAPTLSCKRSLQYYRKYLIKCSKIRWQTEISEVPVGSNSGGRLALYRQIKHNPCTEKYLITMNSLGGRRVMAGLRVGCLPLAVEVGRYTGTPYRERVCRLCNCGEVEDQHHLLIICHSLSSIWQNLLTHCLTLSSSSTHLHVSSFDKCKFFISTTDNTIISLILQMYHLSLLCSN